MRFHDKLNDLFDNPPEKWKFLLSNPLFMKVVGFMLVPSKTFDRIKEDSFGSMLKYLITILIAYSFLAVLVNWWLPLMNPGGTINPLYNLTRLMFILVGLDLITGAIALFIFLFLYHILASYFRGLWLHFWVYLFGGRKGLLRTMQVAMYGRTPRFALVWLPAIWISLIGYVWTMVVEIAGLRELQEMSLPRVIIAYVIAIIIPALIVMTAVAYILSLGGPATNPIAL